MCQTWHEGSFKILLLYICVCVMYVAHMRRWEDSLAELVLFYHVLSRDQTKIIRFHHAVVVRVLVNCHMLLAHTEKLAMKVWMPPAI